MTNEETLILMNTTGKPREWRMKKQSGFTLIEIMVTLVIVGILATVAGTALLAGLNGYMSAKENDAMAQKSQLAMARLSRELTEFTTIPSPIGTNATANSIIVERLSGTGTTAVTRTIAIGLDGQSIKIKEDGEGTTPDFRTGDILIDGVSSLAFTYYRGANPWTPGSDDLRLLSGIRIALSLSRPDVGANIAFSTTVHPRNNGNIGGAALPASPPDQSRYAQCFVATAAYGNYDHPMVLVLREFRDGMLADFGAGRAFIRAYYAVGPSLAGLIEGSPWACFVTRLALLPVVFIAFLLTQIPLAVPGLIVVSWIAARTIIRSKGEISMNPKNALSSQKGAVLIAVVVTMVIFASLGAVMLNLFTASTHSQFVGNRSVRAYYLAEAGYRYAASQYLNAASEAARETALSGLHNQTFTLANNEGQFRFQVYPYWYKVVSTGGNQLQASVIGQYPLTAESYEDGSWVQVKDATTGNVSYAQLQNANPGASGDSARVDFTKYQGIVWESYPAGSVISPVALTKSSGGAGNQTIGQNGDLLLEAQSGYRAFPRWNGVVSVKDTSNNEKTLAYRELYMDSGTGTYKLRGITDPNAATMTGITVAPGTKVILGKFVRLNSRGIVGTGQAMEASRRVDFYIPVGYLSGSSVAANETKIDWTNLNNDWITGPHFTHIGTQETVSIDGAPALHVSATSNVGSGTCYSRQEAGLGFNWMNAGVRFDQAWQAAGGFLSYDVQVKMAVIDPTNLDADVYKNGISFALSEKGDSYGISIYRQSYDNYNCDGLPTMYSPGIDLSLRGIPLIDFWSKSVPGTETFLPAVVVATPTSPPSTGTMYTSYTANFPPQGVTAKAINITSYPSTGDKVRLLNTGGALPAPLVPNQEYYVRMIYKDSVGYAYFFTSASAAYCPVGTGLTRVCAWPDDGSWVKITDGGTGSHEILYDTPMWSGLAYAYLASSSANKDYTHLVKSPTVQAMRRWVTLVIRMKEAPSLYFKNGGDASLNRIRLGDTVYTTSDCTAGGTVTNIARVAWEPVYYSYDAATYKTWNGTARGALVLDVLKDASGNNRPILFDKDVCSGKLFVGTPPGGVQLATIEEGAQDNGYMRKGTWIQVFFADPDDDTTLGAPNTNPFDQTTSGVINRKKIERGTVLWPPDNISVSGISHITEANDYFTMLKWYGSWFDSYVERFYSEPNTYLGAGSAGPDTIWVRNYAPAFVKYRTPDIGATYPTPQQRPEIGLHATGTYGVWSYFDNFAVKLGGYSGTATQGFSQSFQQ